MSLSVLCQKRDYQGHVDLEGALEGEQGRSQHQIRDDSSGPHLLNKTGPAGHTDANG